MIPGPGRFHMPWATKTCVLQLTSPGAATTEGLESALCNKKSLRSEESTHCIGEQPLLGKTRDSPSKATKTQCSQKRISNF